MVASFCFELHCPACDVKIFVPLLLGEPAIFHCAGEYDAQDYDEHGTQGAAGASEEEQAEYNDQGAEGEAAWEPPREKHTLHTKKNPVKITR